MEDFKMTKVDYQTCCFVHLITDFVADKNCYLLSVNNYRQINSNKILLGYYDEEYCYFIPSVAIEMCDIILCEAGIKKLSMRKILNRLFSLNLIKVHWVLTDNVRYRPQKRIGRTRRRYITFYRRELEKYFWSDTKL